MTNPTNPPHSAEVTVVIPGKNCAKTLAHCLESLKPHVFTGQVKEIIFVNDGSTDESERVAQEKGARVLQCPSLGPGAARNLGWRAANTSLIWFVDADCVPEVGALKLLQVAKRSVRAQAVGGSYSNAQTHSLVARLIHQEMVLRHQAIGSTSNFAITANLLCEKSVLEELGGFDESFKLAQDLDLAYRIVDAGHVLGFEAESRVAHFHETHFFRYLKKQARQGYWRMKLYAKHPGRAAGDKYSGLVDYAQPPLAVLALGGAVGATFLKLSGAFAAQVFSTGVASASLSTVLLLQLPMATRIARHSVLDALAYVPFGAVRAGGRGLGMSYGLLTLLMSAQHLSQKQVPQTTHSVEPT